MWQDNNRSKSQIRDPKRTLRDKEAQNKALDNFLKIALETTTQEVRPFSKCSNRPESASPKKVLKSKTMKLKYESKNLSRTSPYYSFSSNYNQRMPICSQHKKTKQSVISSIY